MKKLFCLLLACSLMLAMPVVANANAEYTITIGNTGSEQCSDFAGATAFQEYMAANSDGRVDVQLLFNGVLGSDRENRSLFRWARAV